MIEHVVLFAGSACFLSLLVWLLIRQVRTRVYWIGVTFVFFLAMTFGQYFTLLSHPAPLSWPSFHKMDRYEILGHYVRENEGIFLLIKRERDYEPLYFKLPYETKTAEELQKAMKDAQVNGAGVELLWPEEESMERRGPQFHARPQPAMPPKEEQPVPDVAI